MASRRGAGAYYEAIAPVMLPHIRGRPITMERYPAGIGQKGFFHKDVSKGFPEWLERVEVPKKDGTVHHPIANDARSLLWIAEPELHHSARVDVPHAQPAQPGRLRLRSRPVDDDEPDVLRAAAVALRDLLDELGLPAGSRHPAPRAFTSSYRSTERPEMNEVAGFAHRAGALLVARHPQP